MKLRLSFVLFSVLISCIVSSSSGEKTRKDDDNGFAECAGIYLKSKGEIDHEVTFSKESSFCLSIIRNVVALMRSKYESQIVEDLPEVATCIMNEFDKVNIPDFVMKMAYIEDTNKISTDEKKTLVDNMETVGDDKLKAIATACAIDKDQLERVFKDAFETKPKN